MCKAKDQAGKVVAIKRVRKVTEKISREYLLLKEVKNLPHIVQMTVVSLHSGLFFLKGREQQLNSEYSARIHQQ